MKLRKTKSAIAIVLAVMLLLTTVMVAPLSANAAKANDPVGDWTTTTHNYIHYSFDQVSWENAPMTWDNDLQKPVSTEISIPEGKTTLYAYLVADWGYGSNVDERWYKFGSQSREIQPIFGDAMGRYYAYWENAEHDPGQGPLPVQVFPTSKIQFFYHDFNNKESGWELAYGCTMSSLPTVTQNVSLGDVSIEVDPPSDTYLTDRDVTIEVTNIDSRIPLDQINVGYEFGVGDFEPDTQEPVADTNNHTLTWEGTLTGFTADDVDTGYIATATAATDYVYFDLGTHTAYTFTADDADTTYDITDLEPPVPDVFTEYVTITSLTVEPASMEYDGSALVTAVMTYPAHYPDSLATNIDATITDSTGKNMPGSSTDVNTSTNTVTLGYLLPAGRYSASDVGPVTFTAAPRFIDPVDDVEDVANNIIYHFEIQGSETATLILEPKEGTVPVIDQKENGGIALEVTPESDLYYVARVAKATVNDIDPHIYAEYGNYDEITLTLTDDKGNTFPERANARTNVTATSFETYFDVPADTYELADVGTVIYTVTATYTGDPIYDAITATTYSFTDGQTATDTTVLTSNYDPDLTYNQRYAIFLDAIKMVYRVPVERLDGYTEPTLLVTNLDVENSSVEEVYGELDASGDFLEFGFKVPPSMIVDNKSLVVRAKRTSDGVYVEGPLKQDSVYRYVNQALELYEPYADYDGYKELMSLMVDTLNYAASVQQYIPRRTDKLANDTVAPYQKYSLTGDFTPVNENYYTGTMTSGATYKVKSTRVKFDANITPQFYIGAADGIDKNTLRWTDGVYLEVKINNDVYQYETPVTELIYNGSYEYSVFEFNELMANQLGREIFITVRDKSTNAAVSDTYHYTVNSYLPKYLAQMQSQGQTPDAKDVALLTAMGRYGESARKYALKQHLIG